MNQMDDDHHHRASAEALRLIEFNVRMADAMRKAAAVLQRIAQGKEMLVRSAASRAAGDLDVALMANEYRPPHIVQAIKALPLASPEPITHRQGHPERQGQDHSWLFSTGTSEKRVAIDMAFSATLIAMLRIMTSIRNAPPEIGKCMPVLIQALESEDPRLVIDAALATDKAAAKAAAEVQR